MRSYYITPVLVFIPILLSARIASGCRSDAPLVTDADLKYPPANMIAFKAIIKKISSNGDLDRGKPHGGFQLKLKINKVYQGSNLGSRGKRGIRKKSYAKPESSFLIPFQNY